MHFNYTFQSLWQQPTVATSTTTASVAAAISNLESRLAAATSATESSTPAAVVPLVNSIEHTSSTPTAVVVGALGVAVEDGQASTLNVERRESHAHDVSMTSEPVSRADDNMIHAANPASGPTSFDGAATSTPRAEHVNDQVLGKKEASHFPNNNALIGLLKFICPYVATRNILLIESFYTSIICRKRPRPTHRKQPIPHRPPQLPCRHLGLPSLRLNPCPAQVVPRLPRRLPPITRIMRQSWKVTPSLLANSIQLH